MQTVFLKYLRCGMAIGRSVYKVHNVCLLRPKIVKKRQSKLAKLLISLSEVCISGALTNLLSLMVIRSAVYKVYTDIVKDIESVTKCVLVVAKGLPKTSNQIDANRAKYL